jgi:hypothetical protein
MTYGWTNEAGEPIMSGEAYRFEQQLDLENPLYCGMCGGNHDELNCSIDEPDEDEEPEGEQDTEELQYADQRALNAIGYDPWEDTYDGGKE